jgi:hypothetical protein
MPLRCTNDVNVALGRPACAVKREFFHD